VILNVRTPMETKLHISLVALKALKLIILFAIIKMQQPHLMWDLLYVYHPPRKGKHKQGGLCCSAKNTKVN